MHYLLTFDRHLSATFPILKYGIVFKMSSKLYVTPFLLVETSYFAEFYLSQRFLSPL